MPVIETVELPMLWLTLRDLLVGEEVAPTSASRVVPPETSLLRFITATLEASSSATSSVSTSVSSVITGGLLTVGESG